VYIKWKINTLTVSINALMSIVSLKLIVMEFLSILYNINYSRIKIIEDW